MQSSSLDPIDQVLVLGAGSAGFLAAITLKTRLPELNLTVLRSRDIGIIGVGEGTTPAVPLHLFGYLGLDQAEFYRLAQPTWKLGIKFLWGLRPYFNYTFTSQCDWKWEQLAKPNGYYCHESFEFADPCSALMSFDNAFVRQPNGDPYIGGEWGFHIENERFVAFLEQHARRIGISILDDTVDEVVRGERGIDCVRLRSGATLAADLYVDCSGFRSLLIGSTFAEPYLSFKPTLFCDRAVVGGWDRRDAPIKPYTTAETMDGGWCWQIEHEDRVIRGYVYSSDFLSDDEAERELRLKNPRIGDTRVVKFSSGRYRDSWVQNAVAIGNASGFVEPLEATSLAVICSECRLLAEALITTDRAPEASVKGIFNRTLAAAWDEIRDFLGVHYRFNTRLDTPFWRACRADVALGAAAPFVEFYREYGPSAMARNLLPRPVAETVFGLEGFLTLMVGQSVPYQRRYCAGADEMRYWERLRSRHAELGKRGMGIRDALAAIRRPEWRWNPGFFRQRLGIHVAATGI